MSANMELHERKTAEARLHEADYMDGEPLDIGEGYSVAFHSKDCSYCAWLKRWADVPLELKNRYIQGNWATTKAN